MWLIDLTIEILNNQEERYSFLPFSKLRKVPPTVWTNYLRTNFMLHRKVRPNIILDLGFNWWRYSNQTFRSSTFFLPNKQHKLKSCVHPCCQIETISWVFVITFRGFFKKFLSFSDNFYENFKFFKNYLFDI